MNSCNRLPCAHEVLAVFAHPDDESFGLGAVLGDFTAQGTRLRGLCFTHGEASTLGRTDRNLGEVRREELAAAAQVLGVDHVQLLAYPDNGLAQIPLNELTQRVVDALAGADLLLVFDDNGVTGHPDHRRATEGCARGGFDTRYPRIGLGTAPTDRRSAQRRVQRLLRGARSRSPRHHDRG
ncbi:Mycothiol conjugate amidase Mca [Mycobacterium tuberculosis]|nr:Mycothiol conjugate amidase Mca [Mycobacterium tuberculosis]